MGNESSVNPTDSWKLPVAWRTAKIESLCSRVTSGATPLRNNQAYYEAGTINWFKTGELKDWYLSESEEKITHRAVAETSAKLFPPGTILMAMYGDGKTITSLGILKEEATSNQACCAIVADPSICDHLFLFYSLKYHRQDFIHTATGGAQRNLSGKIIRNFAIRVPPLPEQRAIAHTLSTLDDKIELNRRMNATLEGMARALFKEWFVDGAEEGWEVRTIGDLATISRETINPAEFPEETFVYYSIPAYDERNLPFNEKGEAIKSTKVIIKPNSVLVSKLNPNIPRIWLPNIQGKLRAIGSTEFFVMLPKSQFTKEFLYALFSSEIFTREFETLVTGTSGSHQRVKPESLLAMETSVAPAEKIHAFTSHAMPLLSKANMLLEESRTLAALRDALLPKLLSGKIRVKDAENLVEKTL